MAQSQDMYVEKTLALIKPDAVDFVDEIEERILKSGFTILEKRKLLLSPEQCSDFYAEHYGKFFFPSLTAFMSSAPILALVLAREKAIESWQEMIGPPDPAEAKETHPKSLRAKYGTSELRNAVHGSTNLCAADKEIKFMFPNSVIDPVETEVSNEDYLNRIVHPILLNGLTALCKAKPAEPIVWLADWLMENNTSKPKLSA